MEVTKEFLEQIREFAETKKLGSNKSNIELTIDNERVCFVNRLIPAENIDVLKQSKEYVVLFGKIEIKNKNTHEHDGTPNKFSLISERISDVILLADIHFSNCHFGNDFELTLHTAKPITLSFTKCSFENKLKIRNEETGEYQNDQNTKTNLTKLEFIDCTMGSSDSKTTPFLRVGFLHVKEFVLRNLRIPNNAEVNIGDCHFEKFELSNIRNLGKFKLYKINILNEGKGRKFQLDNTSLGDADMQGINFSSFKLLKIFDNILSGVDYTNINWGDHIKKGIQVGQYQVAQFSGEKTFITNKPKFEKRRDTYRVLKNVSLANNDLPQAIAFYAKEMESYREFLKPDSISSCGKIYSFLSCHIYNCVQKLFKNRKKHNHLERIVLFFNQYSNNFGQNWFLPIIWIFVFGIVCYGLLLIALNGDYDAKLWGKFFVFLNPTHSTRFIHECFWNGWAYFIDFAFRAIEASLIYQAIQAFRRYARKF